MPRGDGTGPTAMGSGTGRGRGYCSGANAPGYASAPGNRGFRCGSGGRQGRGGTGGFGGRGPVRGARRQGPGLMGAGGIWQGPFDPQLERNQLQQQVAAMESNLESMKARLAALEKEPAQG